ncbi:haloacid dehalogenase [Streptococcus pseudoporcinus]|uniref:Haloacid dehalogenase n=1 Tax=Streptococcus pseudoporcinus TaxID=361101 RepID=A0A4U9Y554_9STRE|nr:HAD-IA family hydrolase [Streptococcus pseudoporcinus]VTS20341.1 haloacid dehalogenase [Streptococcus pseudoporcinus]
MNYDDYIWDLGGTLLDNYETSTQAFVETLAAYHLPGSHDAVYAKLKESTEAAVSYFAPFESQFLNNYKLNEAEALANPIWRDGAKEILKKIVQDGGRNFLVSHRDNQVLDLLKEAHLERYFTEIVTANNGFARKPNPESILYLKEKYHIRNALVIGDRPIDCQAGQAANFDSLLVDENKSLLEIVN